MILDSLQNAASVLSLNPYFKQAFEYIRSNDLSKMEPGKIVLNGENLYISIMQNEGKAPEAAKMETHRKYLDIQIILTGQETMGWTALERCADAIDPYNSDKDIQFFMNKPTTFVTLNPGEFVIFFPEDGHAPGIGKGTIKKAVVKVLV
jgi:YhcH/YjgK/YiaL family protein